MKPATDPRAIELLVERAGRPLDDKEHWELAQLGAEDDDSFDLAAAGLAIATTPLEPMPDDLAAKIFAQSPAALDVMQTVPGMRATDFRTLAGVVPPPRIEPQPVAPPPSLTQLPVMPPPQARASVTDLAAAREQRTVKQRSRVARVAPWLAAAACLVLAVGAWLWARNKPPIEKVVIQDRIVMPDANPPLTPSQEREQLLATANDVTTIEWTATNDPTAQGAKGDVVWSQTENRGYMRFVGLSPNDAKQFQYQLWIFDKNRDDKFPVDGGVFDVTSTGEVIVPITAKLPVSDAALFAVTIEKPGGVVVSKRERIVVTAARS